MKPLTIKNIIAFRSKSDKSKKLFVASMLLNKQQSDDESGGDYWISSISALSNAYKSNDLQIVKKIDELQQKWEKTNIEQTKNMYKRNIDILNNYVDFDFKKWQPSKELTFLKKHRSDYILTIQNIQVQVKPNHVFTFTNDGKKEIGAIWIVANLGGYKPIELGMFTDILHRYLKTYYSKEYKLNPKYCIAVDVTSKSELNYLKIQDIAVSGVLNSTIAEIRKLM